MSIVLFSKIKPKNYLLALASTLSLSSNLGFAAVPIDGWYSSVFGGYSYVLDDFKIVYYGNLRHRSAYRAGYNVGLRLGFQSNPLRYEAEYTYINAKLKGFYVNGVNQRGIAGQTQANLGMANVYFDFPEMMPAIVPFVGLGLGYGWVGGSFSSVGPFYPTYYKASDSVFAYQGTFGLTFNFAENFALNVAFRYVGTTTADSLGKEFQAMLGSAAVVYRFNEAFYK